MEAQPDKSNNFEFVDPLYTGKVYFTGKLIINLLNNLNSKDLIL